MVILNHKVHLFEIDAKTQNIIHSLYDESNNDFEIIHSFTGVGFNEIRSISVDENCKFASKLFMQCEKKDYFSFFEWSLDNKTWRKNNEMKVYKNRRVGECDGLSIYLPNNIRVIIDASWRGKIWYQDLNKSINYIVTTVRIPLTWCSFQVWISRDNETSDNDLINGYCKELLQKYKLAIMPVYLLRIVFNFYYHAQINLIIEKELTSWRVNIADLFCDDNEFECKYY